MVLVVLIELGFPVAAGNVYGSVVLEAGGEEVWGAFLGVGGSDGEHCGRRIERVWMTVDYIELEYSIDSLEYWDLVKLSMLEYAERVPAGMTR